MRTGVLGGLPYMHSRPSRIPSTRDESGNSPTSSFLVSNGKNRLGLGYTALAKVEKPSQLKC